MKSAVVLSYSATSEGAKYLTNHLEGRMITRREIIQPDECIINWGGGQFSNQGWKAEWLNKPANVCFAVEKLKAFELFNGESVPHPAWTFHVSVALKWLEEGNVVLARRTSTGMTGEGISILNNARAEIPSAKFYSKHVQHDQEYRVHVFKGMLVNLGVKVAQCRNANMMVRNADGRNWDFEHTEEAPHAVTLAGIAAVNALGLDFGAADVGYRSRDNKAYVFEVNSAPGAGHNNITRYASVFKRYLRSL